jgi:hypothetical protein
MRDRGSQGQRGPARGHPPAAGVTGAEHSSTSHWVRRRAVAGWGQIGREGPGWRPRDDRGGAIPDPDRVLAPRGRHSSQGNRRSGGPRATRAPGRCAATNTAANRPPSHCHHPRRYPTNSRRGHQHSHLDPFAAATTWAMTSRDGQQLVEIAVAQPATIRTTGDLAAAVRAGCVPVAL